MSPGTIDMKARQMLGRLAERNALKQLADDADEASLDTEIRSLERDLAAYLERNYSGKEQSK